MHVLAAFAGPVCSGLQVSWFFKENSLPLSHRSLVVIHDCVMLGVIFPFVATAASKLCQLITFLCVLTTDPEAL